MPKRKILRRLAGFCLSVSLLAGALPLSGGAQTGFSDVPGGTRSQPAVESLTNQDSLRGAQTGFSDVPEDAWFQPAVERLTGQGIISGTGRNMFSPQSSLTRAAFVTMLARSYLSPDQYDDYAFQGPFKDVPVNSYGNRFINWAYENGVVSGVGQGRFSPDRPVTRQEMAVIVVNFANTVGRVLPTLTDSKTFTDEALIGNFAKEAVSACQQSGILSGYKNGTFKPRNRATRAEAAVVTDRFLSLCPLAEGFTILARRISGVAAKAVAFDPSLYEADLITGRNVVDGVETASSIIDRTGAFIGVNATFFDMDSHQTLGTLIRGGEVLTAFEKFAPVKSALTVGPNGRFTIQHFSTSFSAEYIPASPLPEKDPVTEKEITLEDCQLPTLGVNRWPADDKDSTRILFTRAWGHDLAFTPKYAITIAPDGTVLSVDQDKNVEIPEGGAVLAQMSPREYDTPLYHVCQPGDTLKIVRKYEGLTDTPVLSIGAGPQLVHEGTVISDVSAYNAEGFTDPYITQGVAQRIGVGIRPNGSLVLLTARCSLEQFGGLFLAMGCSEAINFDGGGSTNLYAGGFWVYGPSSRKINTMLIFRKKNG